MTWGGDSDLRIVTVETPQERKVVSLHDDGSREKEGEDDGLGVEPEAVTQSEAVLEVGGLASIAFVDVFPLLGTEPRVWGHHILELSGGGFGHGDGRSTRAIVWV